MPKIFFMHGFLGGPDDMLPLYMEDCCNFSLDVKSLIRSESYLDDLSVKLEQFDYAFAYSFGGRLLEEALIKNKNRNLKKIFFASSRHSPYPKDELVEREVFRNRLKERLASSRKEFDDFWAGFKLFSGHSMQEYRGLYNLPDPSWTDAEVLFYLENLFNSKQQPPLKDDRVCYLFGDLDKKYQKESEVLNYNVKAFNGFGHRFCFEAPNLVKSFLREVIGG